MSNEMTSGLGVVSTHSDTRFIFEHVVQRVDSVEVLILKSEIVLTEVLKN
jgi:hypothetical protein